MKYWKAQYDDVYVEWEKAHLFATLSIEEEEAHAHELSNGVYHRPLQQVSQER